MIRKSTEQDKDIVKELIELGFGERLDNRTVANLAGRYYLYFDDDDNKLVAMTGLMYNEKYKALEVDWTCTHPAYRHRGFMQALFTVMLLDVHEKVYCSCWRLPGKDRVNLQTIMDMFGFKEILKPRVSWKIPHNCFRNYVGGCVMCSGSDCECYEDLYLRDA